MKERRKLGIFTIIREYLSIHYILQIWPISFLLAAACMLFASITFLLVVQYGPTSMSNPQGRKVVNDHYSEFWGATVWSALMAVCTTTTSTMTLTKKTHTFLCCCANKISDHFQIYYWSCSMLARLWRGFFKVYEMDIYYIAYHQFSWFIYGFCECNQSPLTALSRRIFLPFHCSCIYLYWCSLWRNVACAHGLYDLI